MVLSIATARALRTLAELRGLVEAVRDAPPGEPETDALEWKRQLDLPGSADDRFNLARHILGMGNRSPAVAGRSFEGCAHLLVGVEPSTVTGCPVWDPADLDNWLTRYVAPGSPRWHGSYVEIDSAQVLVITVEPPRHGDPIFTLQRDYASWRAGRVFVRRAGTTQEASPAEIRTLEARLLGARPAVDLEVATVGDPHVGPLIFDPGAAQRWIEAEVHRYNQAIQRERASRQPAYLSPVLRDPRSEDEYVRDVSTYLETCGARWRALIYQRAIREGVGALVLQVYNPTPGNFERVQVNLTLPTGVAAFFDEQQPVAFLVAPEPPDELGEQSPIAAIMPFTRESLARDVERNAVVGTNDGMVVRYASVHLRPGATETLPVLYMSVDADRASEQVQIGWRATSTSAESWVEGTFVLPVAPEASDLAPATDTPKGDTR